MSILNDGSRIPWNRWLKRVFVCPVIGHCEHSSTIYNPRLEDWQLRVFCDRCVRWIR